MTFPATHRGFLALLLLVVAAAPASWAQQHAPEAAQENQEAEFPVTDLLQSLREVLNQYKTIPFPALPTITIPGDQVSLTISLADVYLEGLDNWEPKPSLGGTVGEPRVVLTLDFKKISILAGSYTSSGHILNLPFNGEGPMYIHLHDLLVGFSFGVTLNPPCAIDNTTDYDLDLIRTEVHFENLNKGTDLGQLVDIVVPSFGQDIVERLEVFIKDEYYDFLDNTLVELINSLVKCSSKSVEDILDTDELMEVVGDVVKDFLYHDTPSPF